MEKRHAIAAWGLLGLVAAGVVVPPFVLWLLQPKTEHQEVVRINGTLPLDVFFLLDASRSVSARSWLLALDFASGMSRELKGQLPQFRAGMGQFADTYQIIYPLSEDVGSWGPAEQVRRVVGHTNMAVGMCGNEISEPLSSCPDGAYGQLASAPLVMNDSGLNCGITRAVRKIILVTDGVPKDPELTVAAARHIKADANASIMGIFVQGTLGELQANKAELYALTSCCPADRTEAALGRWHQNRPRCTEEMNESCPELVTRTDYEALAASVDTLVSGLGKEMDCTDTVLKKTFTTDWSILWFLLLLAPAVVFLCWQNVLLCLSGSALFVEEVRAGLAGGRPEVEMSSDLSSVADELAAATAASDTLEAPASQLPTVPSGAAMPEEAGEGTGASTPARSSMPGPQEPDGADGGRRESRHSETAEGGRKWAPVRTAYIVNGQRVNVDYGRGSAPPPAAQLGAHRGMDEWSPDQDGQVGGEVSRTRTLTRALTRTLTRTLTRRFSGPSVRSVRSMRQLTQSLGARMPGLPQEEVAPPLQRCNFSVVIPAACTVLLVPVVLWKSGVLRVMGLAR